jgi:hypothetical protein
LAAGLVLLAACTLTRDVHARLAAAAVGTAMAAPQLMHGPEPLVGALVLIASVAACLLQAEIYLHIVLPIWRFAHALLAWMLVWARLILARLLAIGREPER